MNYYENHAHVNVPALMIDDAPIVLEVWQVADDRSFGEVRPRYAYNVHADGDVVISGQDLCGPANGFHPEAADMARTLASFLGATFEGGRVTEHGQSYQAEELAWLAGNAERLSLFADDYLAESDAA